MTTYRVSDLTGVLLDAAVAKAEGLVLHFPGNPHQYPGGWKTDAQGEPYPWRPHLDWAIAGPIIGREQITLVASTGVNGEEELEWSADVGAFYHYIDETLPLRRGVGPTPLVAAMRAYVSSKLGETVELP